MRTTVTLDDELLAQAKEMTGIESIPALLREALTVMIRIEAGRRLVALGGSDPAAAAGPRRRTQP